MHESSISYQKEMVQKLKIKSLKDKYKEQHMHVETMGLM